MPIIAVERLLSPAHRRLALGVGAGKEATSYVLTQYFEKVCATDLYLGGGWSVDASALMTTHPLDYAGTIPWDPSRLIVQHQDDRSLHIETGTVDLIYSSSSIEHFGSLPEIAQASAEMGRVVRKGGIISISTEISLTGKRGLLGDNTILMTKDDIERSIVEPSGCSPVDTPCYREAGEESNPTDFRAALIQLPQCRNRLQFRWSKYPHIEVTSEDNLWTSAQITLQK